MNPLVQTAGTDGFAVVSPSGRWVAYQSDDSGRMEVYVSPFPDVGGNKRLVSIGGGLSPVWAQSGEELFFRSDDVMMVVPVETDPTIAFGTSEVLFEAPYRRMAQTRVRAFDLSPDGLRFLMITEEPATDEAPNVPGFVFVEHWREDSGIAATMASASASDAATGFSMMTCSAYGATLRVHSPCRAVAGQSSATYGFVFSMHSAKSV